MTRADALIELEALAKDQAGLHTSLSELLAAQHSAKTNTYFISEESSIEGRKKHSDYAALEYSTEVFITQGKLAANRERQLHLRDALQYADWEN